MVDSLNLMEHKNPMIRLAFFGKMKKIVTSYNNSNLKGLDKRLFRGLFLRNLDHYDEDNISNVKMLQKLRRGLLIGNNLDEEAPTFKRAKTSFGLEELLNE